MKELKIAFDTMHTDPTIVVEPFLKSEEPEGIFYELGVYSGIEDDLTNSKSPEDFINKYLANQPDVSFAFPCLTTVLEYSKLNGVELIPIGLGDESFQQNINRLTKERQFEGLYLMIVGSLHKRFTKKTLVPILLNGFERVTYYKSSS